MKDGLGPEEGAHDDDAMDSGDDKASDEDKASSIGKMSASHGLPVCFPCDLKKIPQCFLCKCKANEPSPLESVNTEVARYGGFRPWNSYRKTAGSKHPKGSLCLICRNVFKAVGYDAKYGTKKSFEAYKKVMAKPGGQDVHAKFLSSLKEWIEIHGQHGGTRIKDKSRLTECHKRLEVQKVKKTGFKAPKRVFVESQFWDEEKDGKFDSNNVTEEVVRGVVRKGIWKVVGRKGAWEAIDEEGQQVLDTTVEEEGTPAWWHKLSRSSRRCLPTRCLLSTKSAKQKQ